MEKFVCLLRGINVGGHKKVPMAELKKQFELLGYKKVRTLLASGNVVFEGPEKNTSSIADHLAGAFGFPIPVIVIPFENIADIVRSDPFKDIAVTPKTRLYITFLNNVDDQGLKLPFVTEDGSFSIIGQSGKALFSVLDLEITGTIEGMKILEKAYGKDITTRNYNTVVKIAGLR